MAGAGYKLFNTGDVLTAAQVNTYLMEQTVMVFDDAAARTTALSGVVSEGMISYLKDTNAVEVYNGSAWVASDDPNAIQNTIVDARGDLIAASANDTPARLAVGNDGETLVADSSTTTGLRWQADFSVGRNKIINSDFRINQRNFSTTTTTGYTFDRWRLIGSGGTSTLSSQTFTPGAAPVAGYEGSTYARLESTGQSGANDATRLGQRIEDVRTFAGQTITVSFWAKASSGTPSVASWCEQSFGSGGSSDVVVNGNKVTITDSWARYSITYNVPSISGKTIGTSSYLGFFLVTSAGSNFNSRSNSLGLQSVTIDFWGVQVEAGSVATAFQTATGTLAGELAAASRYYQLIASGNGKILGQGNYVSATAIDGPIINLPVEMRTTPTISIVTGTNYYLAVSAGGGNDNLNSFVLASESTPRTAFFGNTTEAAGTAGQGCRLQTNNAAAFLALQAEL